MNYRKYTLTLIATALLSTTAIADGVATYLPLTTPTNDGVWIPFGVNGFSNGRTSSRSDVASSFSAGFTQLEDTNSTDEFSTWGIDNSGYMLSVQGIDDSNQGTLKVAVEVLQAFIASEAVRSMYIRVNSLTPNVKVAYKASMEGQKIEIYLGSTSTLYATTLSQNSTYNNPAEAIISLAIAPAAELSDISDVIDYQFGDNPLDARFFSKMNHHDAKESLSQPTQSATFYHYDAVNYLWKIWDIRFSGRGNDFTKFSRGDGYWGRIDVDDKPVNNDGTVGSGVTDINGNDILGTTLILGKSGNNQPSVNAYKYDDNSTKLAKGWNMLAFDDTQPYIRRAATGLVATFSGLAGKVVLKNPSGANAIEIVLSAGAVSVQATEINKAIEIAKLTRRLPKSFNVRAFGSDTIAQPNRIIFISDAKFTLEDEGGANNISFVQTLTGNNPYNDFGTQTTKISDLNSSVSGQKKAISAYGEYSLIVDIMTSDLTGGDTAATLDSNGAGSGSYDSAKLSFGSADKDYAAIALNSADDIDPTASSAKASIESQPIFDASAAPVLSYGKAIELDSLNDGTEDKMIISATTPFYIKDATYTRVFQYNEATANNIRKFNVSGVQEYYIKPNTGDAIGVVADLINDIADTDERATSVYAGVDGSKMLIISTSRSTFDSKDVEDGDNEFFKVTISDSDLAKGAVKGVYALDTIAKMPLVQNQFKIDYTLATEPNNDAAAEQVTVTLNALAGSVVDVGGDGVNGVAGVDTTTERLAMFDAIVDAINKDITDATLHGYAYHDYTEVDDNFTASEITVVGMEVTSFTLVETTDTGADTTPPTVGANIANAQTLGSSWTSLSADLKSNPIYTPDYAVRGPLYTMYDAGYDVRAILKPTTDITDESIEWDGIDLTRPEDEWFRDNEFNLFSINLDSAYWVYLETNTTNPITINTPSYSVLYTYYFDNNDSNGNYVTTNMINVGQFNVNITGLDSEASSAFVSVNGEEIQLKRNGYSGDYTADITNNSLKVFNDGATGPISMTIRATNGKGMDRIYYDAYDFNFTAPIIDPPTSPDEDTVVFSDDGNNTTVAYYVFKEYIPEEESSRVDPDDEVHRLVGKYIADGAGQKSVNLCPSLTFGHVDNLRVVGVDGTGVIGTANVSNAQQFKYATMLKNSHILKDDGGDSNETSIGKTYATTCLPSATQPVTSADNNGVSVKVVDDANLTVRLIYEVIDGVTLVSSVPWTSAYSIGGLAVIHIKSVLGYKEKPFFVQYDGKNYVSAFPSTPTIASSSLDSNASAIKLDDVVEFTLDEIGNSDGGSGNYIDIINSTLLLSP